MKRTSSLKGKTYEEIMGIKKAKRLKEIRKEQKIGTHLSIESKIRISNANKGKLRSKRFKEYASQRMKGQHNPMYGKRKELCPHYGKKRPKHSKFMIEYYKNHKHPTIGITQSKESNKKRSEKLRGRIFTDEHRKNLSGENHARWIKDRSFL